jgi:hypothetical protein
MQVPSTPVHVAHASSSNNSLSSSSPTSSVDSRAVSSGSEAAALELNSAPTPSRSSDIVKPSSSALVENTDDVFISEEGRSKSLADASEVKEDELLRELAARDLEVRTHEQAHASVGGELAGAASYSFTQGPDGARYAVSGEVSIDVSNVPGDPQATIDKMARVRRAALAPAEPSAQDRQVAAMATQKMTEAQADLANQQRDALLADAKSSEDQRERFSIELEEARRQEDANKEDSDSDEDNDVFISVAEEFAEYNARLRQINETLLRISAPQTPSAGSILDDIA